MDEVVAPVDEARVLMDDSMETASIQSIPQPPANVGRDNQFTLFRCLSVHVANRRQTCQCSCKARLR